jgi:hypothetical protein
VKINTAIIFEGRIFGEDAAERDNEELKRLVKELYFAERKLGKEALVVKDLRTKVTNEQLRLINLALKRLLLDSPPAGIEEKLFEYGFAP